MAKEVFQLEVQINSAPALAGLRGINKEAEKLKKNVEGIGKGNQLGGLQKQVAGVTSAFKGLGSVLGGIGLAAIGVAAVKTIADFETLNTVLLTVTGTAQGAAEGMQLIQDVSKSTPFTIDQIGNAFIKLKASGIDPTRESMQLFADVASVTTDKVGALRAITDLYSRTTAGGLGLEELNRLADRGIPVFDILGKRLGVSRLQLSELGKTAEGSAIILRQLESGLRTSFSGNSAKQLNTLNGQFDVFKKNLEGLAISAGTGGLSAGLTDLLKVLNEISVSLKPLASALGGGIGGALSTVATVVKSVVKDFYELIGGVTGLVFAFGALKFLPLTIKKIADQWGVLKEMFKGLRGDALKAEATLFAINVTAGNGVVQTNLLTAALKQLGKILLFISAGVTLGGFKTLLQSFASLTSGILNIGKKVLVLVGVLRTAANAAGVLVTTFTPIGRIVALVASVVTILTGLTKVTLEYGDASASVFEILAYGYEGIINWVNSAGKAVGGFFSLLTSFVPPDWIDDIATGFKELGKLAISPFGGVIKEIDTARKQEAEAKARADFRKQEIADAELIRDNTEAQLKLDRARTLELQTGRGKIVTGILEGIKNETAQIGNTNEEIEIQNKLFEAQNQIRQKLLNLDPTASEEKIAEAINLGTDALRIRNAVQEKFFKERAFQLRELILNSQFEISLLGKSNNEIEKQTKLREYLVAQGRLEVATEEEKLVILEQITKTQEARINDSLNKNLEGLNKEIEYLKLGNKEREIRIALEEAALAAGFKNAEELAKKRPVQAAEIRSSVTGKYLAGIDKAGEEEIKNIKDVVRLNSILDEQERQRATNQLAIYKAIDPDGKGENITRAQKDQLNALLATIEAQEKMLEVQKQITDQFASLGSAVSNWVLGSKDGIKQVKLELLKLIALQAYKSFAAGNNNSLVGSFIEGVIGGISGGRAAGGPVEAGKSYLVGEKGPEIATFGQNGYVIPNSAMMNSRTGSVSNVSISPSLIIQGSVTGQSELDRAFEQFAGAMASETEKLIIRQRGNGILAR